MTDLPEELTSSAFSQLLGVEPLSVADGVAKVRLELTDPLRNRHKKLHGGALFSLIDIAMGLACSSAHGFDQGSVTLECKVNYIRAIDQGSVICVAKVLHAGRRTLVVEAQVHQGDKLVATAQGTFARV